MLAADSGVWWRPLRGRILFDRLQQKPTLCRRGAPLNSDMHDLIDFERYATWSMFSTRTALVMAAAWGVPMTTFMLFGTNGGFGVVGTVVVGALAGLGFGFGWTAWMRRSIRGVLKRLHSGDPRMVPAPPSGATGRLLCNFMLSEQFAVGGHLYLSEREWSFVPHRKNLKRHQHVHTVASGDVAGIAVRQLRRGTLARLMYPHEVSVIEVRLSGALLWSIVAPEPEEVAKLLRARIRSAA